MTWKEVLIRLYGIEKKRIQEQRNFREVAYSVHIHAVESKHRLNVFEFMPLPGDPTKEELNEIRKRQREKEENEIVAVYERAMKLGNVINAKA